MTIHTILTEPNPTLRTISEAVTTVSEDIRTLMDDMLETMYDAEGIGLAAIQIGIPKRIIVMDLKIEEYPEPLYFVNPEITIIDETKFAFQEGCLSVPEIREYVERPQKVKIDFLGYDGTQQTMIAEGLLAVCIQHEMDHLEGILFLDHLSKMKKQLALNKLQKKQKIKLK